jgi:MFS family permease
MTEMAGRWLGRTSGVMAVAVAIMVLATPWAAAKGKAKSHAYNPLNGVAPSLGPLSDILGPKISLILGIIWALVVAIVVIYLFRGIAVLARAHVMRMPGGASSAALDIGMPLAALVMASIMPLIVAAAQK